jgi:hypothetical protein
LSKAIKIALGVLTVVLMGLVIGSGSAILAFEKRAGENSFSNGPWRTDLTAGSQQADMYTRCRVAVHGLLALNPSEAIYYTARTDSEGRPLSSDKVYRVVGRPPDARWWSITAYGPDDFLIDNELGLYSFTSDTATLDSEGKFTICVSKTRKSGNWLPLGNSRTFDLSLRLFNPGKSVRENPASVELPRIILENSE